MDVTQGRYDKFLDILRDYDITPNQVVDILTDFHGLQLLSKEFMENLIKEGYGDE